MKSVLTLRLVYILPVVRRTTSLRYDLYTMLLPFRDLVLFMASHVRTKTGRFSQNRGGECVRVTELAGGLVHRRR
jgi:hypothetical protein